jgi:hypothetical protein
MEDSSSGLLFTLLLLFPPSLRSSQRLLQASHWNMSTRAQVRCVFIGLLLTIASGCQPSESVFQASHEIPPSMTTATLPTIARRGA